jgi:hypothetical protein
MQKMIDNKQTWMTADRDQGSIIGNASVGTVSGTRVIGNAVIGGMAACCETDVNAAAVSSSVAGAVSGAAASRRIPSAGGSTMIGNASVAGGVVGNAVIGGTAVGSTIAGSDLHLTPLVPKRME